MEKGLFITSSYDDFFDRDDIDLIVELTGSMDIYNDILAKKKKNVRAIADRTAQLVLGNFPGLHHAEKDRSGTQGSARTLQYGTE